MRRCRRRRAFNYFGGSVSVIDVATNKVAATVNVGAYPWAIAVTP